MVTQTSKEIALRSPFLASVTLPNTLVDVIDGR